MKSVAKAYALYTISLFGWLGLHRRYLNKKRTARIWLFTFGLFGIGSLLDLFTLPWLVRRHNTLRELKKISIKLQQLAETKEQHVKAQHFENAAACREQEKVLMERRDRLKEELG